MGYNPSEFLPTPLETSGVSFAVHMQEGKLAASRSPAQSDPAESDRSPWAAEGTQLERENTRVEKQIASP